MNDAEVSKFLEGAKHKLENFSITPDQARHAGVMGQIGGGTGALTGAAIGTGIGAAAKHPAQGAGIGAMAGGALGGSGGAALGLYAGRPRKKKKIIGQAPVTLSKSYGKSKGAAVGAASGLGVGAVIGHGASTASHQSVVDAGIASHLADYKRSMSNARMLSRTADFHASTTGRVGMAAGGALAGAAIVRHHQRKIAGQIEAPAVAPIAKMSDDTKTKLARGGLIGAQLADVAAIKSAWHETSTATKTGEGVGAALSYGAKKAALPIVAGGLVASMGAERVMANQQKKLKAAQTATLKPRKSTNGMVAKSQQRDGSYAPVTSLSRANRSALRTQLRQHRTFSTDGLGNYGRRDINAVYRQHGLKEGLPKALKESTRESTQHKNIHFGDSIGPELEGQINHSLDPKLVAGLKRPVVFHHGAIHHDAAAAAAGAHTTTGHKGRVIINSRNIDSSGKLLHGGQSYKWAEATKGTHFHEMINHELVHAGKVGSNPLGAASRDMKTQHKKAMGEEARADGQGVRGRGLYQRNHTVESDQHIHGDYGDTDAEGRSKASRFHYNAVHDKVQDAFGTRLPGQARSADAAFRRKLHGLPPKVTPQPETHIPMGVGRGLKKPLIVGGVAAGVGLAAGSKALYDHYHRDHSGKFAPGSNPSLRN